MGAGSLFADPGLWFVGDGARVRYELFVGGGWLFVDGMFVGGLFMHWVVICGGGGAMSCVVCSWLAKSDGTSGGRVLTVNHNLNNDERHHRSSFGCHVALSDVAPGNPLVLMWPGLVSLVTWCCHVVLVVVVVCVSGQKRVAAIDDETMVVVTEGGGEQGWW